MQELLNTVDVFQVIIQLLTFSDKLGRSFIS